MESITAANSRSFASLEDDGHVSLGCVSKQVAITASAAAASGRRFGWCLTSSDSASTETAIDHSPRGANTLSLLNGSMVATTAPPATNGNRKTSGLRSSSPRRTSRTHTTPLITTGANHQRVTWFAKRQAASPVGSVQAFGT